MQPNSLHGKKILHIDDDKDFCTVVKTQLKTRVNSLLCYNTENGSHALHLLKKFPFDCVICDYTLQDMTGLNLMLNSRDLGVETPFVFLSSREERSIIDKTMEFGALAFHNKLTISRKFDLLMNVLVKAVEQPTPEREQEVDYRTDSEISPNYLHLR
jgi:DNA-binding NtrC family response regulator